MANCGCGSLLKTRLGHFESGVMLRRMHCGKCSATSCLVYMHARLVYLDADIQSCSACNRPACHISLTISETHNYLPKERVLGGPQKTGGRHFLDDQKVNDPVSNIPGNSILRLWLHLNCNATNYNKGIAGR